jgi:NAD(P)-dependent dehydrogenase (short-subunit alcohol dehydrogenase family)
MALFEGKRAVVTGGSSGIGAGLARLLVEEGADVAVVGRRHDKLAQTVDDLRDAAGARNARIVAISTDVRDEAAVDTMAAQVIEAFGGVDILINSAGCGAWKTIDQMSADEWRAVVDTNLTGTFLVTHAFLGGMIEQQGGHIINISSVAGKLGFPTGAAYCASKWGVLGFTRALAAEARPHGIRVDALCPGTVDTPFENSPAASPIQLEVADVVEAARYVMTLPRQVRVDDIVIYPT